MADLFIRDVERVYGPYSPARIKQLAVAGRITTSWSIGKSKEGPWAVAGNVRGLFPVTEATPPISQQLPVSHPWRSVGFATLHKDLLVLFTTDWCGPCRKLKRDLAGDDAFRREVLICVVDCDKQKELSNLHQVRGIPDLRLYRKGEQFKRQTGYGGSLADLQAWAQAR